MGIRLLQAQCLQIEPRGKVCFAGFAYTGSPKFRLIRTSSSVVFEKLPRNNQTSIHVVQSFTPPLTYSMLRLRKISNFFHLPDLFQLRLMDCQWLSFMPF